MDKIYDLSKLIESQALVDPSASNLTSGVLKSLRFLVDSEYKWITHPMVIVSPINPSSGGKVGIAAVQLVASPHDQAAGIHTNSYLYFKGSDGKYYVLNSGYLAEGVALSNNNAPGIFPELVELSGATGTGVSSRIPAVSFAHRVTSPVNTAQVVQFLTRNLTACSIHMICSAGTATLTVEASADASNWITIDSIAAGGTIIQQYDVSHLGATIALNPMNFLKIKITAGAAGAGNTTTLTVGAK